MHLLLLIGSIATALADPAPEPASVVVSDTTGPITIDGLLDEESWQRAIPVTDFRRYEPTAGGPPPGQTEVRFLQDEQNLYVGIRVTDAGYPIRARISPRESINADDQMAIFLDTFGEAQGGYNFWFNPLGIQQDIRIGSGSWNPSWDTVLYSEGRVTETGYDLEIAIPFRSLRFPSGGEEQTWGLILARKIPATGSYYSFPETVRRHPILFSQAAPLQGIRPPPTGAGLELQPTLTVGQSLARADEEADLAWSGLDPWNDHIHPGLDLRLGLSPDMGLAVAVNPDFSQVESDTTRLDLNQRFAFFYPELRPFFLAGVNSFEDNGGTLYTRSIVEPIYGVKLAGREGHYSIGVLHALDQSPAASLHQDGTPGFATEDVEETLAANSFLRLQRDVGDGGYVGMTIADKRMVSTDGGANDVWSLDSTIPLGGRWTASGFGSVSQTSDLGQGLDAGAWLTRASGVGTGLNFALFDNTPDYRNEVGFFTQTGLTTAMASIDYTFEPEGAVDSFRPAVNFLLTGERDGDGEWRLGLGQTTRLAGVHRFVLNGGAKYFEYSGVEMPGWDAKATYSGDYGRVFTLFTSLTQSREIDYSQLIPADSWRLTVKATSRPDTRNRIDASMTYQHFTPEGQASEQATTFRGRLNSQLTRAWGLRLIGEVTTGDAFEIPGLETSALLTWLSSPGTAAYVGASQSFLLDDPASLEELVIFAKLSWLFRS